MKEFLKDLRNEDNKSLINKLNYNQQKYNKWYNIYKFDRCVNYNIDTYLNNMNKIKQVFKERKININFRNGWEII